MKLAFLALGLATLAAPLQAGDCRAPLLDVDFRPLAGRDTVNLCERYAGQVLLVVNTASKCGFTPQYEGLEALHADLSGRGFAVLGFPSNDFMGQEPGTEEEIREFCTNTYGVQFPMFEKVSVKGKDACDLYKQLTALAPPLGGEPEWNFTKFLVDRSGNVVARFNPRVKPDADEVIAKIDELLASK